MPASRFRRIVVKLSGEALGPQGLNADALGKIADDLKAAVALGTEIAVVVGGGNFFRGLRDARAGIDRQRGDAIGMLGTVMNAIALEGALEAAGQPARAMSAVDMPGHCDIYRAIVARDHMAAGRVVLLGGGTGNPFFTTDTAAALRAAELNADVVLKATQVDGVYSADPKKDPSATRYERLTHDEAIAKGLGVMDTAAFALARENRIPILVFSNAAPGAITAALTGEAKATLVAPDA